MHVINGDNDESCSKYGLLRANCFENIPAEGKPRERFDWLLPGESQSPVIYNIKCSSDQFG